MEKPNAFTANDSASGVMPGDGSDDYQTHWTSLSVCPTHSRYALLIKGKRYGMWWMLKALKPELRDDVAFQMMLRKEFMAMATLVHPNIVATAGWEQIEGFGPCIVMEWIDGDPMDVWLQSKTTRRQRLRVAHQLIDALAYIHSKQMVHRDLKPQNVMITRNGCNVKLIDFGLTVSDRSVLMKSPAGTQGYADPEQCRQTNVQNDIFSLGQVLRRLHLGVAYRNIPRKCCRPQRRRYHNVDEVRAAMRRAARLPRAVALSVVVVVLASVFALYVSHKDLQQQQQMEK